MGSAVSLRNVVGKAKHLLAVTAVPLHRHFNTDVGALITLAITHCVKNIRVQDCLTLVGKIHKTFDATGTGEIVFFAGALIFQSNLDAIVQKAQFTQTFAEDLVVKVVVLFENVGVRQKVNFRAALVGVTHDLHGRDFNTVDIFKDAVLHKASGKLHGMHLTVATNRQPKHFGQCVDATHTHTMQTT